ncbi:MAG: ATP-binding protein [Burkholderiaceae bacterium]
MELLIGAMVAAVGVAVLVGWALDISVLKRVFPGGLVMRANTAAALLMCGLALTMVSAEPTRTGRRLVAATAAAVALIGGLTLIQHLFSLDFGIDELLFRDRGGVVQLARPGRMSAVTAYCFVSMAAVLALLAARARPDLLLPLAAALSTSVAAISVLALAGKVSVDLLGQRWGSNTTMAFHTAIAFLFLSAATLLHARRLQGSAWALGRAGTAGFVVGAVLMLGSAELAAGFARDMQTTASRVENTQQTLQQLQEIRTDLRALESAQRAHLLLADEALLDAREAGKALVLDHIAKLSERTQANGLGVAPLDVLRQDVQRRFDHGDHLIAVRRTQGFEAARALLATGEDVALTARITAAIAPMLRLQRDRLAADQAHLQAATATTFRLLPIGSFFGLAALLAGLYFLEHGVSERRRAEQALARSQTELRVVFDSMAEGIRVIDSSHNIVQVNPAGATVHGLIEPVPNLDDIVAQVDALTLTGDLMGEDEWPGPRALHGDFVRNFEMTFRRRDTGRVIVVELTTAPLPAEPGQPALVVITTHDITERKHAEVAIRESQDRLEKVIENLTEGLLIHGLSGELVHWNRAALAMYELPGDLAEGMAREEFQRTFELSTLAGLVLPLERWPMSRLMQGDVLQGLELRIRRTDRDWERVFCYGGALVRDAAGKPLVFLTVTDVTARKTAELQLQVLNTELEQRVALRTSELQAKARELESFCFSVSHDLKAPLRGIDGYSRLLADEYGDRLDADGHTFIGNVRRAAAQMNTLIEDLLAYSQQERRAFSVVSIRLRPFVEEQLTRRALDLAGVRLSVDVEDVRVLADREGLAMALRNLIDNAIKFSARSKPPVIGIHSASSAGRCVLSVQDNGTGFEMRHYARIFEIFQRLHRAEDYPGTGVGLALVRKAMERMGGRVWAESTPGQGAVFHLDLERAGETGAPDTVS